MSLDSKAVKRLRKTKGPEIAQAREERAFVRKREEENRVQLAKPISNFSSLAYVAFEETFKQIYEQSLEESTRLQRNNAILRKMEDEILDDEVLETMSVEQKLSLFQLLRETNASSIKMLLEFSKVFKEIRSQVGFYEGLKETAVGRSFNNTPPLGEVIDSERDNRRGLQALTLLDELDNIEDEEEA